MGFGKTTNCDDLFSLYVDLATTIKRDYGTDIRNIEFSVNVDDTTLSNIIALKDHCDRGMKKDKVNDFIFELSTSDSYVIFKMYPKGHGGTKDIVDVSEIILKVTPNKEFYNLNDLKRYRRLKKAIGC